MIEHHQLLVTAMTFGAPIDRSERLIYEENDVAADDFGRTTHGVLKALVDARYSQKDEKGLPSLTPLDPDLPHISFDIPQGPPWARDLAIDMADLLAQGMAGHRRVRLGLEHMGLDADIRRTCLKHIGHALAKGLFDPNSEDHATATGMRQPWASPDLELAFDLPNAWSPPALHVMDGFHVVKTIPMPIERDATKCVTIHVDALGGMLWSVMPTRIFFKDEDVPQGIDLLRILAETER